MTTRKAARSPRGSAGKRRTSALDVATYGVLAALALVFGYVESLMVIPIPVPGIKLGLGNVIVLFCLEALGIWPAVIMMLVKVMASALLFGNPTLFIYSFAGGCVSLAAMACASRVRAFSVTGVSMVGGVFHMVGQLVVVGCVLNAQIAVVYLPPLLVSGLITGLVVGYFCRAVLAATESSAVLRKRRKEMALHARHVSAQEALGDRAAASAAADGARAAGDAVGAATHSCDERKDA